MALVNLLKDFVNLVTTPWLFIGLAILLFFVSLRTKLFWTPKFAIGVTIFAALFIAVSMLDHNFALIIGLLMAVHFWRVRKDGGISGPL